MENVGKRTPTAPMEMGCRSKWPSDIAACHFARDLEIYSKEEYNEKLLFRLMAQRTMNVTSVALVSPHGFKNEVYIIVARLFRLMA